MLENPARLDRADGDVHPEAIRTSGRIRETFLRVAGPLTARLMELDPGQHASTRNAARSSPNASAPPLQDGRSGGNAQGHADHRPAQGPLLI